MPACCASEEGRTFTPHMSVAGSAGERAAATLLDRLVGHSERVVESAAGPLWPLATDGARSASSVSSDGGMTSLLLHCVEWTVDHVCFMSRRGFADPFSVVARIPIGGVSESTRLTCDVPLVLYRPPAPRSATAVCLRQGGNGRAILAAREES